MVSLAAATLSLYLRVHNRCKAQLLGKTTVLLMHFLARLFTLSQHRLTLIILLWAMHNKTMKTLKPIVLRSPGLILEDVKFGPTNTTVLCDVSSGQPRPIVPSSWRRKVFEAVRNLSHPSIRVTPHTGYKEIHVAWHK